MNVFGSRDFVSPIVEWLITLLSILLASIVTVDVILKKNDVRAALGWTISSMARSQVRVG